MKKLLSLLSILTITGTAMPITIAASSYKKEEFKLDSNINYSQTNNLKNLNRNKRENNQINNFSGIVKLFNNINISIFRNDVILKNKTYFGGNKNVEEYDILIQKTKSIINTNGQTTKYGVVLNNKVYFGSSDNNVYEYDTTTGQQKIVIVTNGGIISSGVSLNNKVYFGSNDHNVYEYDPATREQKIVIRTGGQIWSSGVSLNNKVYFSSNDHNVYEYNCVTKKQKIIFNIRNDNIMQYASGVVSNNKIYFGSIDGKIYGYEPLELIESDIIDLQEQIRRGAYLYYQEQNPNSYVKNIEFNMNDLKYSDIELIKRELVSNIKEVENICDGIAQFENKTSDEEEYQTQNCKYTKQSIKSYQILKGLNKRIDNTLEKGTSNTGTSSILNSNSKSKISQTGGEVSAGGSLFGIGLSASISHSQGNEESNTSQTEKLNSKTENISQIISNSSSIDLSNVTENQKIETREIEFPSQKVKVGGNQTKKLTFTLNKTITKNKFIFNQYINGKIKIKIIDEYNNITEQDLLIKDVMNSLKNNGILPKEIVINNSDISFQGSFLLNKVSSSNLNIVTEEIDTI
ncbi:PQQ-binding-like beta-propeller repeat protein [Spiroplasma endosymbiont of Megaselia nigra]|uniref:PQQ-binding-like beta-propeller repeat protein n=1 Tax=Spiroplasma endosymbiont of Megaselia nigra TaxID=2478537 RepID=UPI000F8701C4|nr:PQQ-binding-like beta-propeller repeat protein [Spiroplasma endosymbiont of Megaselia nigra]RUO86533.1 hypothetical protein D9R21_02470 [Spiroplasma endosymbiont of Megaselia nigra]